MYSTILDHVSPADLGLPEKFSQFRDVQREIADFALYGPHGIGLDPSETERRFVACGAPTGCGKSVAAHTIGILSGVKYGILTATRALEDQMVEDGFNCVNIRGRANYQCKELPDPDYPDDTQNCEEGAENKSCGLCGTVRCTYGAKVQEAREARAFVTNYSYWMHARSANQAALETKKDPVGLLICDEAHLAMRQLAGFLALWVSNEDLHAYAGDEVRALVKKSQGREWGVVTKEWVGMLTIVYCAALSRKTDIEESGHVGRGMGKLLKELKKLEKMCSGLERIVSLGGDGNWIWRETRLGIAFECVWPGRYAERYLWSGVKKVVLMSATLRPKAMQLLGLRRDSYWFREWPRVFPAANNPVYWIPTGRMGHKAEEEERLKSVARLDEIADEWAGGKKGIVHTNSYNRAEWIQGRSRWGRYMILNDPGEQAKVAQEFKGKRPPAILVSPSYTTGFDFPDDDCEWIVFNKLPFPDRSDPVMQARIEGDREYYDYETMQALVQGCGRGARHEKDRCVVMITDDAVKGFRYYARQHAPGWFRIRETGEVPRAN